MNPIPQTIHLVDQDANVCMVISGKGNIYPVDLNHYCKEIKPGDTALVVKSNVTGEWLLVDVEPKYPKPLDVTEFPRDENNCLDIVAHSQYLQIIEGKSESERVDFDNMLLRKFIQDYGMKNTLKHRYGQLGYEISHDMEPESQATLEEYL